VGKVPAGPPLEPASAVLARPGGLSGQFGCEPLVSTRN